MIVQSSLMTLKSWMHKFEIILDFFLIHIGLKVHIRSNKSFNNSAEGSAVSFNLIRSRPNSFLLVIMIDYNWQFLFARIE